MSEELNNIPAEEGEIKPEVHELSFNVAETRDELKDMVSKMGYIEGLSPQVVCDAIDAGDVDSMPDIFDLKATLNEIIAKEGSEPASGETVH